LARFSAENVVSKHNNQNVANLQLSMKNRTEADANGDGPFDGPICQTNKQDIINIR
jgi:hypothetical protein